ncbi:uncharacterized protein METZ01_LOCUS30069 [marine metagenome]|uniref:Uncharacterized protein n=1 Tax=marine metagenome TaxID=408172 RepID=A0A381QD19_9ZZZZ
MMGDDTSNPPAPWVHSRNAIMRRLTMKPNPMVVSPRYIPVILSAGKPMKNPNRPTIRGEIKREKTKGIPTWSTRMADV